MSRSKRRPLRLFIIDHGSEGPLCRSARAAMARLLLSARAHDRMLRVARKIADLEGADAVGEPHVAEALRYRTF